MVPHRYLRLFWLAGAMIVALLAWWAYFFFRQGDFLAERMARDGAPLSAEQLGAVRSAAHDSLKMFLFEGGFLALVVMASIGIAMRSLERELAVERQQKNFLSAVTHELRSPIASARLYIESLLLGRAEGEKRERYLQRAMQDIDRLRTRVDDLLETARMNSTRPKLVAEPLDLAAIALDNVNRLKKEHSNRGAQVELDAPEAVMVRADPRALETVLQNLISNAIKYGGREPRVLVTVRAEAHRARLAVRDFGPGLAGADPKRIFDPFVRGDDEAVRSKGGVGLGLYLVRELVTTLGGKVSARDGLDGGGTEIAISLALAPAEART